MKLISYNLEKHRAVNELKELVRSTEASTICIQEARVEELPQRIEGLELIASTPQNRLGLAIYADRNRYELENSFLRKFRQTLHDRVAAPAEHRLLGTVLRDKATQEPTVLASFHASPLTSLNSHRRRQIEESLQLIGSVAPGASFIMAGDYNYPVFRRGLTRLLSTKGYQLNFSDLRTYKRSIFRGHFDFVTSKGYRIDSVRTLPKGASDHSPILINSQRSQQTSAQSFELAV